MAKGRFRVGVDIGGTFTDFCLFDEVDGTARTHKRLTTPEDPSEGVVDGMRVLLSQAGVGAGDVDVVVHGTTLVTNAVIERRGTPTAMLVTRGFADVVNIARERRYDLFDLSLGFPAPIVARPLRFEVAGRLRSDGTVLEALELSAVEAPLREAIERAGVRSVAVCFLHSYANAKHEADAVDWLSEKFPGLSACSSADVFPFMREYERWTTTCINAYVQPVVDEYLDRVESGLSGLGFRGHFLVMNSSGGTLTGATARRYPVRLLESGPAAGALMSATHGRGLGLSQLLSFDMGGTTAKGCIIQDGTPLKRYDLEVGRVHEFKKGSGLPVKIPVLDMIEIGAGGGSLAGIDERGLVRVGPQSAGASPGPACYGRGGTRPTLTDANLVLGYLGASSFLGGAMPLDEAAARTAIEGSIASPLGLGLMEAAWGIHEVINEDVARAFRVHASERGVDYRRCSMVVFGGSGPVHGARIARKLRIPRVICPMGAGVMSAFGLLVSPLGFEVARSRRIDLADLTDRTFDAELDGLGEEMSALLAEAGVARHDIYRRFRLDMRYQGQGYEIEVAVAAAEDAPGHPLARLPGDFAAEYRRLFGLTFDDRPIEVVNWKVEAQGPKPHSDRPYRLQVAASTVARKGERNMWLPGSSGLRPCAVFDRYSLKPDDVIEGPALVEEAESTCVLHDGDRLVVDDNLNLVVEVGVR
jgi:N-methylhydantoinase A